MSMPSEHEEFNMAYSAHLSATPLIAFAPSDGEANRLVTLNVDPQVMPNYGPPKEAGQRARLAKSFHDARRAREGFFAAELFSDPAWDILLILYWASYTQRRMSVSHVCGSAGVPPTTALRWIEHLRGTGLLHKKKHPTDGRVIWVSLTDDAQSMLDQYFDGVLAKQVHGSLQAVRF